MKNIKLIIVTVALLAASSAHANTISAVLSGTDNGFGYSGLHHATGNQSMSGASFSGVSLDTTKVSYFHDTDLSSPVNFSLYLTLDDYNGSSLHLTGQLNFNSTSLLIGELFADFADENIHADTTFKFARGTMNIGGVNVPQPNTIDGNFLSLWGANSSEDPLNNSIGFDPNSADLGMDLVLQWNDVPEPTPLSLLALCGIFLFLTHRKYAA